MWASLFAITYFVGVLWLCGYAYFNSQSNKWIVYLSIGWLFLITCLLVGMVIKELIR